MSNIRQMVRVQPGHRVEVVAPELVEGEIVEVIVSQRTTPQNRHSLVDFLDALPTGPRAFETWEQYEQHLLEEKASWER